MMAHVVRLFILLAITNIALQDKLDKERQYISGAVVEYYGTNVSVNSITQDIVMENAANYEKIIESAEKDEVDIIVFPEYGLTGYPNIEFENKTAKEAGYRKLFHSVASYIPDPKMDSSLCKSKFPCNQALKKISCAAMTYQMYVVINFIEKVDCNFNDCPADGFLLFNSNVVFNRNGTIVARYRKYNLLNDYGLDRLRNPEPSYFTTDFGVTFGQLIGTDILMKKSDMYYTNNLKITNIVMPTRWLDELPLMGFQHYQSGWAYATDSNLFVSSTSSCAGTSGSGVFHGKGGPVEIFRPEMPSNAFLFVLVPTKANLKNPSYSGVRSMDEVLKPPRSSFDRKFPYDSKFYNPEYLNSQNIEFNTPWVEKKLCVQDFCCYFTMKFENTQGVVNKDYQYRAIVYSGPHVLSDGSSIGLETCAFAFCRSNVSDHCNFDHNENLIDRLPLISHADITEKVGKKQNKFSMPISELFKSEMHNVDWASMSSKGIHFGEIDERRQIILKLKFGFDNPYFGIFSRRFDYDGKTIPYTTAIIGLSIFWFVLTTILVIIFVATCLLTGTFYYLYRIIRRNVFHY